MKKILSVEVNSRLFIIVILVSFFLAYQLIFATFTPPSQEPPLGNITPPLNISSSDQVKDGGLSIGSLLVLGGSSFSGDMGIGTILPTEKLDVVGNIKVSVGSDICIDGGNCLSTAGGGVSEINDLTDGKTDASSVFLGLGAGINDDGTANLNTAVGIDAFKTNITGNSNTAFGYQALYKNTVGGSNVASGYQALYNNTIGWSNIVSGYQALYNNTTGFSNIAFGHQTLYGNTTGFRNIALGTGALYSTIDGYHNIALGRDALYNNIGGYRNIAQGRDALYSNTIGNNNVALGTYAAYDNTEGEYNIVLGKDALYHNTTGDNNIALGYQAGRYISSGASNQTPNNSLYLGYNTRASVAGNTNEIVIGDTAIGNGSNSVTLGNDSILNTYLKGDVTIPTSKDICIDGGNCSCTNVGALEINDLTDGKSDASSVFLGLGAGANDDGTANLNTAVGIDALNANITGYHNTASGYRSLYFNTVGYHNIANGYQSLYNNVANRRSTAIGYQAIYLADNRTTGRDTYNTAVGYQALRGSATAALNVGQYNTAFGDNSLFSNKGGDRNTASGYFTLQQNTNGSNNTASGYNALSANAGGFRNTAIGSQALEVNVTGYQNTVVGYNADTLGINYNNAMALGANAVVTASNRVRIGNTIVARIGGQVNWSNLSDRRKKKNIEDSTLGLGFIQKLRPVTFNFKEGQTDVLYTGLIAQEVEDALDGVEFSGLNKPENEGDYYSLGYASFVTPLINAVQEIWNKVFTNQEDISELKELNSVLMKENEELKKEVEENSLKIMQIQKYITEQK